MSKPYPAMPADLAEVIATHQALFGGYVMQDNGTADAEAEKPPADTGEGYPANTPIKDMTAEQQASYWKSMARKHEDAAKARADYDAIKTERDQLKQSTMTADEKALEDAKKAAFNEGKKAGAAEFAPRIVKAEVGGALRARGLDNDRVQALIGPLDHTYFLTESGEVDADKVSEYAAGFGQGGNQWPDMGQGKRGNNAPAKGVGAGRDLYAERHGKNK